jgi:hypothetical protein
MTLLTWSLAAVAALEKSGSDEATARMSRRRAHQVTTERMLCSATHWLRSRKRQFANKILPEGFQHIQLNAACYRPALTPFMT